MSPAGRALVCLPTYDERENLAPILAAIRAAAPGVDVLVIDDDSPDGTGRLADELAARDPRVKVLHRAGDGPCTSRTSARFSHRDWTWSPTDARR